MKTTYHHSRHQGTIIPMLAISMTALFGFVALAIDLGLLAIARTECQSTADAAALAGARLLNNRDDSQDNSALDAMESAYTTVLRNRYINTNFTPDQVTSVRVGRYDYNQTTRRFELSNLSDSYQPPSDDGDSFSPGSAGTGRSWTGLEVVVSVDQPTFFARVLGISSMPNGARALAVHRPRDIAMVIDRSVSMKFGSATHWEAGWGGSNGNVRGLLNPDPAWPKFGHFSRYTEYSENVMPAPNNSSINAAINNGNPSGRPNPLWMTQTFIMSIGEILAPNNHTVETPGGPPAVFDFRFDPSNRLNPSQPATTVDVSEGSNNLWNAFHRWFQQTPTDNPDMSLDEVDRSNVFMYSSMNPAPTSSINMGSYIRRTFNWSGYNAFDRDNMAGPTPAPEFYDVQASGEAVYFGDRFPRKNGVVRVNGSNWLHSNADGAAVSAIDLLGWGTFNPNASNVISRNNRTPNHQYQTNWRDFRDATWERYGYDLDVDRYVSSRPNNWDPRWDWNLDDSGLIKWAHAREFDPPLTVTTALSTELTSYIRLKPEEERFQGYSMGPGYWGKTFYMWPPDPRWGDGNPGTSPNPAQLADPSSNSRYLVQDANGNWLCDWRRRFFIKSGMSETNLNAQYDPEADNINQSMFRNGIGHMLHHHNSGNYNINYRAVLAWIKSGPQTLPPNLRAGRILYYTSIPDDCDNLNDPDKRFWREYIDFVLGYTGNRNYNPERNLAGVEYRMWPEGSAQATMRETLNYNHQIQSATPSVDPRPYMNYSDNPNRPRMHFWFGPTTMLDFISCREPRRLWWPATSREAQSWQVNAAVNSALEDIRINHPNDYVAMTYFATTSQYYTPRVSTSQNWKALHNVLFYPFNMTTGSSPLLDDPTYEERPYNNSFNSRMNGVLPNANGGTDPISGLTVAFNCLSSSNTLPNNQYPTRGRRGAAKIVIFETDGVPNNVPSWSLTDSGLNTRYQSSGNTPLWHGETRDGVTLNSDGLHNAAKAALTVVRQTRMLESEQSGIQGGLSTPGTPARVYSIGFGDLFEGYVGTYDSLATDMSRDATRFLLLVQQLGGTSPWAANAMIEPSHIIGGDYRQRINDLRTVLERILQSGVQVTLIE